MDMRHRDERFVRGEVVLLFVRGEVVLLFVREKAGDEDEDCLR